MDKVELINSIEADIQKSKSRESRTVAALGPKEGMIRAKLYSTLEKLINY